MWENFGIDILKTVTVMAIGGFVAWIFTKKYLNKVLFARKMQNFGFRGIVKESRIPDRELDKIFKSANSIKILFVTGINFLTKFNTSLTSFAQSGKSVKILLCNPQSDLILDIEILERSKKLRVDEKVKEELKQINDSFNGKAGIEIRYYRSEYRLPLVIADFGSKKQAWLCVTLMPNKSTRSFYLCGEKKYNSSMKESEDETSLDFIDIMEEHFDNVWQNATAENVFEPSYNLKHNDKM